MKKIIFSLSACLYLIINLNGQIRIGTASHCQFKNLHTLFQHADSLIQKPFVYLDSSYRSELDSFPIRINTQGQLNQQIIISPDENVKQITFNSTYDSALFIFNDSKFIHFSGCGKILFTLQHNQSACKIIDSEFITLSGCSFQFSNNLPQSGAIIFGSSGKICSNNSIINCQFEGRKSMQSIQVIYSSSSTKEKIQKNKIEDCLFEHINPKDKSMACIHLSSGNTNWNISRNRFFSSDTISPTTTGTHYGIRIAEGHQYQISDNVIGGIDPSRKMIWKGSVSSKFFPLAVESSLSNEINIARNRISHIEFISSSTSGTSAGIFSAISVNAFTASIQDNSIGDSNEKVSLVAKSSSSGSLMNAIYCNSNGNISIKNNSINGIQVSGINSTSMNLNIISTSGKAKYFINNNKVGGTGFGIAAGIIGITKKSCLLIGIENNAGGYSEIIGNTFTNLSILGATGNQTGSSFLSEIRSTKSILVENNQFILNKNSDDLLATNHPAMAAISIQSSDTNYSYINSNSLGLHNQSPEGSYCFVKTIASKVVISNNLVYANGNSIKNSLFLFSNSLIQFLHNNVRIFKENEIAGACLLHCLGNSLLNSLNNVFPGIPQALIYNINDSSKIKSGYNFFTDSLFQISQSGNSILYTEWKNNYFQDQTSHIKKDYFYCDTCMQTIIGNNLGITNLFCSDDFKGNLRYRKPDIGAFEVKENAHFDFIAMYDNQMEIAIHDVSDSFEINSFVSIDSLGKLNHPNDIRNDGHYYLNFSNLKTGTYRFTIHHEGYFFNDTISIEITSNIIIVNNELADDSIQVYPNPSQEIIQIISPYLFTKYSIQNIQGSKASEGLVYNQSIPLLTIQNGVYILILQTADNKTAKKVFIKMGCYPL